MKQNTITILFCPLVTVGTFVLYMRFDSQLQSMSNSVNTLNSSVASIESNLARQELSIVRTEERLSVAEESIDPRSARWAKIKKVRDVVQKDMTSNGLNPDLTISDVTVISAAIVDYSEEHDVPLSLVAAIIRTESAYNPKAVSATGAQGLMQIMPDTAEEISLEIGKRYYNIHKITDNVQFGSWYIWKMLKRFKGNMELAIMAYNCGPTYVEKVQAGVYPDYPEETKKYLETVSRFILAFQDAGI